MIDKKDIFNFANEAIEDTDLVIIDVVVNNSNEVEVTIDSKTKVSIEQCIRISKYVEDKLNREVEDFSLSVFSAGIGNAIKHPVQFEKLEGEEAEIIFVNGRKLIALVKHYDSINNSLEIEYSVKELLEGSKRKTIVTKIETVDIATTKTVVEHLTIK